MNRRALHSLEPKACLRSLQKKISTSRKIFESTWSQLVDQNKSEGSKSWLKVFKFEVDFSNSHKVSFLPRHFFLCIIWSWIDVRYIPWNPESVLEAYKRKFQRLEKFLSQLEVNLLTKTSLKALRAGLKSSNLRSISQILTRFRFCRAIFFYVSYDHESTCATFLGTQRVS